MKGELVEERNDLLLQRMYYGIASKVKFFVLLIGFLRIFQVLYKIKLCGL